MWRGLGGGGKGGGEVMMGDDGGGRGRIESIEDEGGGIG